MCSLTHGWLSPQRAVPQDTGFSSLFLKVLMQILQWLDSPAVEDGPLQAQLKLFATRYSARRRISDGEQLRAAGGQGLVGVNMGGRGASLQRGSLRVCGQTRTLALVTWFVPPLTVRSGLLHLAEALSFHHDLEVANSTVRAVITTLKSGEKCTVEPELISKGTTQPSTVPHSLCPTWTLLSCACICLELWVVGLLDSASFLSHSAPGPHRGALPPLGRAADGAFLSHCGDLLPELGLWAHCGGELLAAAGEG